MPLSEREQALLEQMEQALRAEDPRLAAQLASSTPPSMRRRRLAVGVLGVVVGLAIVLAGVTHQLVWVGVGGFLVMVVAAVYGFTSPRAPRLGTVQDDGSVRLRHPAGKGLGAHMPGGLGGSTSATGQGRARGSRPSGTFMQRLEQRWDDRRARGDF